MKISIALIAASVLLSSAAYANTEDGSLITRGTNQVGFSTIPFVSDRTAKQLRRQPNCRVQPGDYNVCSR